MFLVWEAKFSLVCDEVVVGVEIAKCAGLPRGEKGRETRVEEPAGADGACTWDLAL